MKFRDLEKSTNNYKLVNTPSNPLLIEGEKSSWYCYSSIKEKSEKSINNIKLVNTPPNPLLIEGEKSNWYCSPFIRRISKLLLKKREVLTMFCSPSIKRGLGGVLSGYRENISFKLSKLFAVNGFDLIKETAR